LISTNVSTLQVLLNLIYTPQLAIVGLNLKHFHKLSNQIFHAKISHEQQQQQKNLSQKNWGRLEIKPNQNHRKENFM
jgi:hypothetical protein